MDRFLTSEGFDSLRLLAVAAGLAVVGGGRRIRPREAEDWRNLYLDAKPVLDVRYRYEHVDQDTVPRNGQCPHRGGPASDWRRGRFYGVSASGSTREWIEAIGDEDFNDTINGRTEFPVVADPG